MLVHEECKCWRTVFMWGIKTSVSFKYYSLCENKHLCMWILSSSLKIKWLLLLWEVFQTKMVIANLCKRAVIANFSNTCEEDLCMDSLWNLFVISKVITLISNTSCSMNGWLVWNKILSVSVFSKLQDRERVANS